VTTAAGLWAVAALGMAAGAGMFTVGALGTGIILLTLVVLHWAESRLPRRLLET
jgi:putative Mg2+ transporter-C (MgtC) family protein